MLTELTILKYAEIGAQHELERKMELAKKRGFDDLFVHNVRICIDHLETIRDKITDAEAQLLQRNDDNIRDRLIQPIELEDE